MAFLSQQSECLRQNMLMYLCLVLHKGSKVVSQPADPSWCDSSHSKEVASLSLICPSFSFREETWKMWPSEDLDAYSAPNLDASQERPRSHSQLCASITGTRTSGSLTACCRASFCHQDPTVSIIDVTFNFNANNEKASAKIIFGFWVNYVCMGSST